MEAKKKEKTKKDGKNKRRLNIIYWNVYTVHINKAINKIIFSKK
jgi:hypothetical protein